MDTFSISVVIPTFNRAQFILKAIKSVFDQTLLPLEVIVIDDGSDDQTAQIVKNEFPQCKYIYQNNNGVSSARNTGIKKSTGNWIAFLDSDDQWCRNKLSIQLDHIRNNPDIFIFYTDEIWIRSGKRVNQMNKHKKHGGDIFLKCLPLCLISPSSVIIKKELFDKVGNFDESLPACEDYDLWLRICAQHKVHFTSELLIKKFAGHADQLSGKYWGMDRFRITALENIILNGSLSTEKYNAALKTMLKKIEIYITGARKRGKSKEVTEYQEKKKKILKLN